MNIHTLFNWYKYNHNGYHSKYLIYGIYLMARNLHFCRMAIMPELIKLYIMKASKLKEIYDKIPSDEKPNDKGILSFGEWAANWAFINYDNFMKIITDELEVNIYKVSLEGEYIVTIDENEKSYGYFFFESRIDFHEYIVSKFSHLVGLKIMK